MAHVRGITDPHVENICIIQGYRDGQKPTQLCGKQGKPIRSPPAQAMTPNSHGPTSGQRHSQEEQGSMSDRWLQTITLQIRMR